MLRTRPPRRPVGVPVGMVGVTIDCRLKKHEHRWPAGAQDVAAAVAWLRANVAEHGSGGRGVSVLFDNVGPETWAKTVPLLDRTGRFVCSGATTGFELTVDVVSLYRNHTTAFFYMCGPSADLADSCAWWRTAARPGDRQPLPAQRRRGGGGAPGRAGAVRKDRPRPGLGSSADAGRGHFPGGHAMSTVTQPDQETILRELGTASRSPT